MVAEFCTDHNILDIDVVAVTTGTATADDAVGVVLIDHPLGPKGCIDLADATLLNQYVTVLKDLLQLM